MKFKINYYGQYEDSFIIEADTIKEVRELVKKEQERRGWADDDCYSEEVNNEI